MQPDKPNSSDADAEDFTAKVLDLSHDRLVVVDFWADWCPPCRALTPVLETLAAEYTGRFLLVKVEVDAGENMKLAGRYRLRGFPSVILFRAGMEQARFSGYRPAQAVRELIDAQLPRDPPAEVRREPLP